MHERKFEYCMKAELVFSVEHNFFLRGGSEVKSLCVFSFLPLPNRPGNTGNFLRKNVLVFFGSDQNGNLKVEYFEVFKIVSFKMV